MALLSWSDQYLIGNDLIDAEHTELFRLINDFHTQWQQGREQQSIVRVLNQLVVYTEMHFRHEETIMRDAGFAQLDEHMVWHEAMVDTIFELQKSYEEGSLRLEMETMKFVKAWLLEHILKNDYRFRDFLAHRNNLPEAAGQ
jgi:hemerythrin